MRQRLQNFDFDAAANWLPNCRLVWSSEGEIAFQSTQNFFYENLKLIRNLNNNSYFDKKHEVKPWTGNWAIFMNWLPDMLFAIKEELCIKFIKCFS